MLSRGHDPLLTHKVKHDEEQDEVAKEVVGVRALLRAVLEVVGRVNLHTQRHYGVSCITNQHNARTEHPQTP